MTTAEKLLPEFDAEMELTRKMLALAPDEHWLWKPHEKSMELGRLAWHTADFPEWALTTLTTPKLVMGASDADSARVSWKEKRRADVLARFDGDLAKARTALAGTSDAAIAEPWKMEWNGRTLIDQPREEVYRKWCISHMVHHRAQLGMYLRLLGVAIPGCYGPSADEMMAMAGAAAD